MTACFVTGTDTGVGKTFVACALLHRLQQHHRHVVGMKPVAAGATRGADGLRTNDDVIALQQASSIRPDPCHVNPYLLNAPVSPHIAARRDGIVVDIARIRGAFVALREQADAVVVEGAGGFRVPLTDTLDGADLAVALDLPVILVVGLKLGCLSHALLTAEAIAARGLRLAGWVANRIDPAMPEQDANLELLRHRLDAPCIGDLPHSTQPDPREAASLLHLPPEFLA
jgi:dethiobiotin synthetase